jgi:hypothetical protein
MFSCACTSEGTQAEDRIALSSPGGLFGQKVTITGSDPVILGSFRSANMFNGVDNYMLTVPTRFSLHVSGTEVVAEIVKDMTLSTASWVSVGSHTPVEVNGLTASGSGGRVISANIYGIGTGDYEFDTAVWGTRGECMTSLGGSGYGSTYSVRARKADPSGPDAGVQFAFNWVDVK